MKLQALRNARIRSRLEKATLSWREQHPKCSFVEPDSISVPQMVRALLYALLFALLLFLVWHLRGFPPLLLSLLILALAIKTFLHLTSIHARFTSREVFHLLPVSEALLTRQLRLDLRRPFAEGIILTTLFGLVGTQVSQTSAGPVTAPLIYLGTVGLLMLSYYWFFFELFVLLIKAALVALSVGLFLPSVRHALRLALAKTPWLLSFHSPLALTLLVTSGALIAWQARDRWSKITGFNRLRFYESHAPESEEEEVNSPDSADRPERPVDPIQKGTLECWIWKWLSPKEKAIVRSCCYHDQALLKSWLTLTISLCGLLWLTRFHWPWGLDDHKGIFVMGAVIFSGGLNLLHTDLLFLSPVRISPQHNAPAFQVFPITLGAMEKLMWKRELPRIALLAITFTLAVVVNPTSQASLGTLPVIFLIGLVIMAHLMAMFFWNQSINGWVPRRNRGRGWAFLVELTLLLGILLSLGCIPFVLTVFRGGHDPGFLFKSGIFLGVIVGYQLILRSLVRAFVADRKSDLVGTI